MSVTVSGSRPSSEDSASLSNARISPWEKVVSSWVCSRRGVFAALMAAEAYLERRGGEVM